MKYKILIIIFIILLFPTMVQATDEVINSQKESLNIKSFLTASQKYTEDIFPEMKAEDFLNDAITGNINNGKIYKGISILLGKEIRATITAAASILIIIVIHSILNSISINLGSSNISQVSYYVQFILIVTIIMGNFIDIMKLATDTIQNLVGFMYSLIPIVITLMLATGSIVSGGLVQPILLLLIQFIGNIIIGFAMPVIMVGTVLGIISNVSDKVQINKISKYLKSGVMWFIGIVLTLFVTVLSLEGTMSSSVDGVTAKTAKAAVSTLIPVVGKILGDAIDSVLGCTAILKNAVGILGVVVIIGICVLPIIKLTILTITYFLLSAIAEPIADTKIVNLLSTTGDTFKIILAILFSISAMLIVRSDYCH